MLRHSLAPAGPPQPRRCPIAAEMRYQVRHHGQVHGQSTCPKHRESLDELERLEWDERRGRDHCEVFGPAPFPPKPHPFSGEESCIKKRADAQGLEPGWRPSAVLARPWRDRPA
jgi:hypothetical protein